MSGFMTWYQSSMSEKSRVRSLMNFEMSGFMTNITNLDPTIPDNFDNNYCQNLQNQEGLFQSDQVLFSTTGADTVSIVNGFINDQNNFFEAFVNSMIKMGNIGVLTGSQGEIRTQYDVVNPSSVGIVTVISQEEEQQDQSSQEISMVSSI